MGECLPASYECRMADREDQTDSRKCLCDGLFLCSDLLIFLQARYLIGSETWMDKRDHPERGGNP